MEIKAGQVWLLKSAEICRSVHSAFVDEMAEFCGKEQTIEIVGDEGRFYIIGCDYFWDSRCLDQLARDVEAVATTFTPEPCPERVDVPKDTVITKQGMAQIGETWLLKKWHELSQEAQFQMVDTMMAYLGKAQRITGLGDDHFEVDDGLPPDDRYRFPYECLDRFMPWAPAPENGTVDTMSEAVGISHKAAEEGMFLLTDMPRTIRRVESSYDVLQETEDGAGCVTIKLFVDHRRNTYRVASTAKDGRFLFDTKQGNPKIWRAVLKAIGNAMEFAEREVG